jgi:hypothetical protein
MKDIDTTVMSDWPRNDIHSLLAALSLTGYGVLEVTRRCIDPPHDTGLVERGTSCLLHFRSDTTEQGGASQDGNASVGNS